tara:strand:+ start:120001 stop:120714 length:714 start_codon:yes stop_codon:yes gene_type:complete
MTETIDDSLTLDPPGSIAVVGAGPLGIEAALYGRFLGYDVTLIESDAVGHSLASYRDQPLPMLPDRCLSSLALSALQAQNPDGPPITLPVTVAQWIDQVLIALTETDLLRGRLRCPFRVTSVAHVTVDQDADEQVAHPLEIDAEESDEEVPPDFVLSLAGLDGQSDELVVESVIQATGAEVQLPCEFPVPCDYLFRIGETSSGNMEQDLRTGLQQIAKIYAVLGGRATLDLYRPQRT